MKSTTIIAFDQHAATTVAAVLLPGQRTPALHTLTSETPTIVRFVERLGRERGVECCYEAGPCGFDLQRALSARQIRCEIIAPALIPRRAGDRIKTDRRDAGQLAVLYRAGALTAIHIPTEEQEAARDLLRCREDIRADLLRARHRLSKFLLRHGRRFTATKKAWSNATMPGCARRPGRCHRSIKRIAPTCARSTKRSLACATSKRSCGRCSISSRCGHASNACAASVASTI
jgi:transposase